LPIGRARCAPLFTVGCDLIGDCGVPRKCLRVNRSRPNQGLRGWQQNGKQMAAGHRDLSITGHSTAFDGVARYGETPVGRQPILLSAGVHISKVVDMDRHGWIATGIGGPVRSSRDMHKQAATWRHEELRWESRQALTDQAGFAPTASGESVIHQERPRRRRPIRSTRCRCDV